jgi:hypothetical protein
MAVKRCGCALCQGMCIGLTHPMAMPRLAVKRCGCALCKAMYISLTRPTATPRPLPMVTPTIGANA